MQELVGHEIVKVLINDNRTLLRFIDKNGQKITYVTEGDCCSETWFHEIVGGAELLGKVESVEEIPMVKIASSRQDVDELYGIVIRTLHKAFGGFVPRKSLIVFRNSSNGYYGGSVCLWESPEDVLTEWLPGTRKKLVPVKWEEVTNDVTFEP